MKKNYFFLCHRWNQKFISLEMPTLPLLAYNYCKTVFFRLKISSYNNLLSDSNFLEFYFKGSNACYLLIIFSYLFFCNVSLSSFISSSNCKISIY